MKILVTGSSGHLGEALVRTLAAEGHHVTGIDIEPSSWTQQVGSIADAVFVDELVPGHDAVIHAATLHKPHIVTHSRQDFVDTNVSGTLNLLQAAATSGVGAFVFTSTTSTFGNAMRPGPGDPAVWVDETLTPQPRNIYGVTKRAAEDLCELFARSEGLPCVVLRTSRFFQEIDDDPVLRDAYEDDNIKLNELLYRRADIADMVSAHRCALDKAPELGFGRFIITATTPFRREDCVALGIDAPAALARRVPGYREVYRERGWRMFPTLGRVYDNTKARQALGWEPQHNFAQAIARLAEGRDYGSELARQIGVKGYHDQVFEDGPYPVD